MADGSGRRSRGQALGSAALGLLILALLIAGHGTAGALTVDGRLSSASFISETFPPDEVTEWDLINRLSVNVRGLGHPGLSLHWYGVHRGEALEVGLDKSRPRTYHGYLAFAPRPELSVALGRMWVYAGVGSGRMDGARLSLQNDRLGRMTLFGGTRGWLTQGSDGFEGFDSDAFDTSGVWGAQLRSRTLWGKGNIALSAARLFRDGVEEGNRLGATLEWRPCPMGLIRYEHRYDLSTELSYYQHLRFFRRLNTGSFSLAWNRRQPLPLGHENSYIFEHFGNRIWFHDSIALAEARNDMHFDEFRAHYTRPGLILPGWDLRLELLEIFPEDADRGDGFSIGWSKEGYAFGYRLQRGYGGEQDALYGSARYGFVDWAWAWIELNQVYYRYDDDFEADDDFATDDDALATRIGVDALLGDFDGTFAIEYLDNARAGSQVRYLARIGYRFHHVMQNGEE